MVAASPRVPRPRVAPDVRRPGVVYCIPTRAADAAGMPIPGTIIVGYVGRTWQQLEQREAQHRATQSFSDLIVGSAFVVERGFWTDAELAAREEHYIRNGVLLTPGGLPQRPIYNHDHNLENPHRIEIWRARKQRQAREPGWQPPPKTGVRIPRQRGPVMSSRVRHRSALARWWGRWWARHRRQVIRHGALWLAMYIAASWLASHVLSERHAAIAGAVVATVLYTVIAKQRTKRWWRRATSPRRGRGPRR